jgi:hypothetical protein
MKESMETMRERDGRDEEKRATLRELGVPGTLARDIEAALKVMGNGAGDRIVGFTFVTSDGARHQLRLERERSDPGRDRAA